MIKLKPQTLQEAFDMAYKGVMKQGRISAVIEPFGNSCMYHGGDDVACAIGHMLDVEDRKALDVFGPSSVDCLDNDDRIDIGNIDIEKLSNLQGIHDDCGESNPDITVEEFRTQYHYAMQEFAKHNKLVMPEWSE